MSMAMQKLLRKNNTLNEGGTNNRDHHLHPLLTQGRHFHDEEYRLVKNQDFYLFYSLCVPVLIYQYI